MRGYLDERVFAGIVRGYLGERVFAGIVRGYLDERVFAALAFFTGTFGSQTVEFPPPRSFLQLF